MAKWTGRTEGSLLGYKIVIGVLKVFGLKATYFILRFISFYYYLFASTPRNHLIKFYQECLLFSKKKAKKVARANFYLLAQSLIDKFAFTMGKGDAYHFTYKNEDKLQELAAENNGLILISAHFGNWDIAGQMLTRVKNKINVLMYENEHEKIKGYVEKLGKQNYSIIPQKQDMSHLIKMYQAVKKGEILCMHADRYVGDAPTLEVDFCGQKAYLPAGPFQIMSKLKVPFAFTFIQKEGDYNYHYSAHIPNFKELTKPQEMAQSFADIFEERVKESPDHWFNYFEFHHRP
ncbi:MAG: lysophospholipid acyltransferase family protein [Reichenbachiella sp.]